MVTHRLYFDEANLATFSGRVAQVTEWQGRPAVVLDATAFYPEGGGQPADRGRLGNQDVVDVQEDEETIYHLLAQTPHVGVGAVVEGAIDWQRRFDHMQQHTGQHTISGACWRLLGAATASWHLGSDEVTIDIDRVGLSEAAWREVEQAANEVLWHDVPVTAALVRQEDLAALSLRKGTERAGLVRVVSVGDWDRIGCGGTHVATSGQVGAIGIRQSETRGTQSRITFVCGARALADFHHKTVLANTLIGRLKAPLPELAEAVTRLQGQLGEAERTVTDLRTALSGYEARDLLGAATHHLGERPVVAARFDGRGAAELRQLAQHVVAGNGVALLGAVTEGKAQLVFACPKDAPCDMNQMLKAVLPLIGGKGGGQRTLAQGGGSEIAGLDMALEQAQAVLLG